MHRHSRSLRSGSFTAAAALALLVTSAPAALADGEDAVVTVDAYECTSIDVTSTKDISNVVLEFADGDRQRFEGLGAQRTGSFAGTGDHSGEVITTAWVKSGDNKSGDGPGYGERKDFDSSGCGTTDTTDTTDTTEAGGTTDASGTDGATGGTGGDTDNSGSTDGDTGSTDTGTDTGSADGDTDDIGSTDTGTDTSSADGDTGTEVAGADVEADHDDATQDASPATDTEVLGVVLDRAATSVAASSDNVQGTAPERGLNAAAGTQVRAADTLANAGADALPALVGALAALGLGAGLLRRSRSTT